MSKTPLRYWLVASVCAPLIAVVLFGTLQAQPGIPRPPVGPSGGFPQGPRMPTGPGSPFGSGGAAGIPQGPRAPMGPGSPFGSGGATGIPQGPRGPTGPGSPFGPGGSASGIPQGPTGPSSPFGPNGPGGGIPDFPKMPDIPTGPRGPRFGDDLFRPGSGFGGPPEFVWVFTCSKCGRELGKSKSRFDEPPYDTCPHCGVSFTNKSNFGWTNSGGLSTSSLNTARQAGVLVSLLITALIILAPLAVVVGSVILIIYLVRKSSANAASNGVRKRKRRVETEPRAADHEDLGLSGKRRRAY